MADAFEQELLTDIAAAEAIGEVYLAAEWRLELDTYRAAKKAAIPEEQVWAVVLLSTGDKRSESGAPTSRELTYFKHYAPPAEQRPVASELRTEVVR